MGTNVTMVRIYLTEGEKAVQPLLARLHDEEKVRGARVSSIPHGYWTFQWICR